MPVGRIRAFRSKQCPFWVNFGYVVPEIKYAPKLVELIRYNGYGIDYDLCFMKLGGALAAKIIDIDRQHTPTAKLCSPRAIRSKKSEAWFHKLKECIRFISKLSSYHGFQVANTFTFEY